MKKNNGKPNKKTIKAEEVRTEEDLRRYLKETNHPFAELVIKARDETIKKYGRLLTTEEIDELYFN